MQRRGDQIERAGKFRREREDARRALRGGKESLEELDRGRHDPFRRMHAAPRWTDERTFEVDAQNFGLGRVGCPATPCAASCIQAAMPATAWQVRSSLAVTVVATSDVVPCRATVRVTAGERLGRAFHDVVAAGAVNVHIHETRRDRQAGGVESPSIAWHGNAVARTDCHYFCAFDDDHRIGDFLVRRKGAVDKDGLGGHEAEIILLDGQRASLAVHKKNGRGTRAPPAGKMDRKRRFS